MASFVWMLLTEPTYNRARLTASPGGRGFWARRQYATYQPSRGLAPSRANKAARTAWCILTSSSSRPTRSSIYATRVRAVINAFKTGVVAPGSPHDRQQTMEPSWSPVVATGGNQRQIARAHERRNKPRPLLCVATGCRRDSMV